MGAAVAGVLGIGGALIQGIGAANATQAQAAQMYASAGRAIAQGAVTARDYANQAAIDNRQAKLLEQQGSYDAARATTKGMQLTGAQVAGYGSNGIALSGSVADVIKSTGKQSGLDIMGMRYGVSANVQGERIMSSVYNTRALDTLHLAGAEALDMVSGAKNAASSATFAFVAPLLGAGGTLLKSAFA